MTNLKAELTWTPEAEQAFIALKTEMAHAAHLNCADYSLGFFLDVSETGNSAHGVLFQKQTGTRRVLMYDSVLLDGIEQCQPTCARFVTGLAKIIEKTSHIVMGHQVTVLTTHSVMSFVNSAAFTSFHISLMFVHSSVNRISGFTPFELLTGRSFPGPSTPLRPDQITPLSHCVYFDKLTALIKQFSQQVTADNEPEPIPMPTEWVRLKKFRRKWNEARWSKPLRVTSRTLHCVRLAGKGDTWYHLSSCAACDPPSRSLAQTAVDLRTQVQEREGESKNEGDNSCVCEDPYCPVPYRIPEVVQRKGDIFSSPPQEPLAHCVSADCAYGAGIAVTFKDKYGVEKVRPQNKKPGECTVTQEEDGRIFFNLITKRKHMRDWCVEHRVKSVSVPWLGRSLDKLDSQRVQNILSEVFTGVDIVITIYTL